MRNKRSMIGIVAVLIAALTASIAWAAPGDVQQTIKGTITPSKLPKKKFKNAAINVVTTTGVEGEGGMTDEGERPPPAERALLTFDKDVKFVTNGTPKCTADLTDTTTEQAKEVCGRSQVGAGRTTVGLGESNAKFGQTEMTPNDGVVTAFNGPTVNGKPSIILHARVNALNNTSLLAGVLGKNGRNPTLNVTIPQIANGQGSVLRFQTRVAKGKYVQAKCPDRKLPTVGKFFYDDGTSKTVNSAQTCQGTRR